MAERAPAAGRGPLNGRRIVLRREEEREHAGPLPDYAALIRPVADVSRADDWSWEWPEEGELRPGAREGG